MKYLFKNLVLIAFLSGISLAASAADGTIEEAMALVKKAAAFNKANGNEKMLVAVGDKSGQFVDRDLYLSVLDLNGKVLAHGANLKLIGKDTSEMKDKNDKYFIKEILATAKTKGHGFVEYSWPNAVSGRLLPKTVYLEKVDNMIIFSGATKR